MATRLRHSPPDETNRAICERIRHCRIEARFNQSALAKQIKVSRDQLKRIEEGTVSPRFWPTWRFCQLLDLNPLWVAFGAPYEPGGWATFRVHEMPEQQLFSNTMRAIAEAYARERERFYKSDPAKLASDTARSSGRFIDHLSHFAGAWKQWLRPIQEEEFLFYISDAAEQYFKKSNVDEAAVKYYLGDVIATSLSWRNLKRRLRSVTKKLGAKTALARLFNVSTAAVSQWLSPRSRVAPKAETALRLLEWVAGEEAKQKKSAGRASTRSARTTQAKKSKHEKPKSGSKPR